MDDGGPRVIEFPTCFFKSVIWSTVDTKIVGITTVHDGGGFKGGVIGQIPS